MRSRRDISPFIVSKKFQTISRFVVVPMKVFRENMML